MTKKGGLAIALLLVVTGALRWISPGGSSAPGTPPETETKTRVVSAKHGNQQPTDGSHGIYAVELEETVREFFGLDHDDLAAIEKNDITRERGSSLRERLQHWNVPQEDRPSVRFLIALLPDPVHTQLNLSFDRGIEIIQQAAQEQGYDFDRATMPWDISEHAESNDFVKRDQEASAKVAREAYPGLMIFRPAMQVAPEPPSVLIFSGSVRGTAQRCWFQEQYQEPRQDNRGVKPGPLAKKGLHVRFVRFQDGEDHAIRKFLEFVTQDRGYQTRDVAILSEDETSYGDVPQKSKDAPPTKDPELPPGCKIGYGDDDESIKLQFPRGISQFRAAYQKHVGSPESQDSGGEHPVLPLDLQATGNEDDSVQPYAKAQFPLSQEAVMLGIIARLHRSHPRFIVLRASDPVDQLFLTRYLRENYPQARVVVTAPDLLYAREDDGLMHGVLGIGAYSLAPEVNRYLARGLKAVSRRPRPERAFPGASEQGGYNAMVSLLAISKNPSLSAPLLGNPSPQTLDDLPPAPYSSYGSFRDWRFSDAMPDHCKDCQLAPGLWISMLARDGYWMIDAFPRDCESSLHQIDDQPVYGKGVIGPHTPKSWSFVYAAVLFLLFLQTYLVYTGTIFSGSEIKARFGGLEAPDSDGTSPNSARPPDAPAAWPADTAKPTPARTPMTAEEQAAKLRADDAETAKKAREDKLHSGYPAAYRIHRTRRARLLAWGTSSFAVIAILLVATRYAGISRQEGVATTSWLLLLPIGFTALVSWDLFRRRGELRIAASLFAGIVVLALLTFVPKIGPLGWYTTLTAYRALHLVSGISPLVPFLFLSAAFYIVCWHELQALCVTDGRRPRLPGRTELPAGYHRVSEEDVSEMRNLAASLSIPARVFVPIVCCLVPLVILIVDFSHPHPIQTVEGAVYDWLYFVYLLVWVVLFLGCLSRLIGVWNECRRFLGGLDNLPLRDAFKNLQDFSWNLIWTPSGSALRDSFKYVSRELQSLASFHKAVTKTRPDGKCEVPPELKDLGDQIEKVFALQRVATAKYRDAMSRPVHSLEDPKHIATLMETFATLQEQLGRTAGKMVCDFLHPAWSKMTSPIASEIPKELMEKESADRLVAEEFVSLVYANFLTTILLRVRTLVMEAIGIFLLLLFSISSYPFEPNPDMFTLAVVLILLMGLIIGTVYAQMHRDPALSRLTSTNEGELGVEFWGQFLAAGAVPVLSLLAVQFPSISRILTNLLGPALQAIK